MLLLLLWLLSVLLRDSSQLMLTFLLRVFSFFRVSPPPPFFELGVINSFRHTTKNNARQPPNQLRDLPVSIPIQIQSIKSQVSCLRSIDRSEIDHWDRSITKQLNRPIGRQQQCNPSIDSDATDRLEQHCNRRWLTTYNRSIDNNAMADRSMNQSIDLWMGLSKP